MGRTGRHEATIGRFTRSYTARAITMERTEQKKSDKPETERLYDLRTPVLDRFYRAARKRVKFPRYYKKALNW
jgi:hypothetical protein